MSCQNDKSRMTDTERNNQSAQHEESAPACPCGQCPEKAKKVLLAGLVAGLGIVALRAIRRGLASA